MSLASNVSTLASRIATEFNSIRTALAGKAASVHTHVPSTDLVAAGIKDATTYLRGDNTWAEPPGGGGEALADVQTAAPSSPSVGQMWLDTDETQAGWNGVLVVTLGASDPVPTGLPIGSVIVRRNS